jgi:uncharacterized damage-inducible protein DinB
MTPAITLEELVSWNNESAVFWNTHLEANPALLELPCGIGNAANVQGLVRHIWAAELRMSQRIADLPVIAGADVPHGPLSTLLALHEQADQTWKALLADASVDWASTVSMGFDWLPEHARTVTRRKLMSHTLLHAQRHWAQLTTLLRNAGFPSGFQGDLLFSRALL